MCNFIFNGINAIGKRIVESNNRNLGILAGCTIGVVVGGIFVTHATLVAPLLGATIESSPLYLKILGVLLATGTGGNLFSYIGSAIDIISNEKTIFNICFNKNNIKVSVAPQSTDIPNTVPSRIIVKPQEDPQKGNGNDVKLNIEGLVNLASKSDKDLHMIAPVSNCILVKFNQSKITAGSMGNTNSAIEMTMLTSPESPPSGLLAGGRT